MTTEELETIVSKHEMQRLELKESFGVECIETACAFTNAQGGFIVIGVDNHGNLSQHQLRGEGLRDYENRISTATEPCVKPLPMRSVTVTTARRMTYRSKSSRIRCAFPVQDSCRLTCRWSFL